MRKKSNIKELKKLALLFGAALVLLLNGCQKKEEEVVPEKISREENAYYFTGEDAEIFSSLQTKIDEAEPAFGVAYLGKADELAACLTSEDMDEVKAQELLDERVALSQITDVYPFVDKIPYFRVQVVGEGTALYLIVPETEVSGIGLYEADDSDSAGDLIKAFDGAYPLLVITGGVYVKAPEGSSMGFTLTGDGSIPENALDISFETVPVDGENLKGDWVAQVTNDMENHFELHLEFEKGGDFSYYYIRKDAGNWMDQTLMHFSGTWEILSEDRVELDTTADGGTYMDGGVPAYDSDGRYDMKFCNAELTKLIVTQVEGDPFFTGITEREIIFEKVSE